MTDLDLAPWQVVAIVLVTAAILMVGTIVAEEISNNRRMSLQLPANPTSFLGVGAGRLRTSERQAMNSTPTGPTAEQVLLATGVNVLEIDSTSGHPVWEVAVNPADPVNDWIVRPSAAHQAWMDEQCGGCDNGECCGSDNCPACECDEVSA